MRKPWIAILLLLLTPSAVAETIQYEIYEMPSTGGEPHLIAKGTRQYTVKDVEVYPYQRDGISIAEKLLELERGYRIGARIFYEKELTGFGLLAKRSPTDFSWEWYRKVEAGRFRKLQGGTYVTVRAEGGPGAEELAEVTFQDDTRLRFKAARAENDTHVIVVKAGSVLRLK